jgi:hypothetical protein
MFAYRAGEPILGILIWKFNLKPDWLVATLRAKGSPLLNNGLNNFSSTNSGSVSARRAKIRFLIVTLVFAGV